MPRGIPKNGVRAKRGTAGYGKYAKAQVMTAPIAPLVKVTNETDAQIEQKLNDRFDILELMTKSAMTGSTRAMIVSGPPGLGKSFTVEQIADAYEKTKKGKVAICKGYIRPTGLYKTLYNHSQKGDVVIFDDCDAVFMDHDALNLLKAACDTTDKRTLFWGAETRMVDDGGDLVPTQFAFQGSVIFITNYDFDYAIESGHRLGEHFSALVSRSHYISMGMRSQRDYLVRIKQVVKAGMLKDRGLSQHEINDIVEFVFENADKLRELTLRVVIKLADLYKVHPTRWNAIARQTMFKPVRS